MATNVWILLFLAEFIAIPAANSLFGIMAGARQVECTINGIGERAGNAALEEIVMAIKTRKDEFKGLYTDIVCKEIYKTSRLVSSITGMEPQANKSIVGKNAFLHESGIHQDGVFQALCCHFQDQCRLLL